MTISTQDAYLGELYAKTDAERRDVVITHLKVLAHAFENGKLDTIDHQLAAGACRYAATHDAAAGPVWPDFSAPAQYENPAQGWEDPHLPDFRLIWATARQCGYSIGLHGSMKRDCDLIAAPWTNEAVCGADLVDHLCKALNARIVGEPEPKPLGRVAVTIQVDGYVKPIDLSICPTIRFAPSEQSEADHG